MTGGDETHIPEEAIPGHAPGIVEHQPVTAGAEMAAGKAPLFAEHSHRLERTNPVPARGHNQDIIRRNPGPEIKRRGHFADLLNLLSQNGINRKTH